MISLRRVSSTAGLCFSSYFFLVACGAGSFSAQTQDEIDKANGVAKVVAETAKLNSVSTDQPLDQVATNLVSFKGRNKGEARKFRFVARYSFNSGSSDAISILEMNSVQLAGTCAKVTPIAIRLIGNSASTEVSTLSADVVPNTNYELELSTDLAGCMTTEFKLNPIVWLGKKSDNQNVKIATACVGSKSGAIAFFPTYFMTAFVIKTRQPYIDDGVDCGERFARPTNDSRRGNDGTPLGGKRSGWAMTAKGVRSFELEFTDDGKSVRISCKREDGTAALEEFRYCERRAMDLGQFLKTTTKP